MDIEIDLNFGEELTINRVDYEVADIFFSRGEGATFTLRVDKEQIISLRDKINKFISDGYLDEIKVEDLLK